MAMETQSPTLTPRPPKTFRYNSCNQSSVLTPTLRAPSTLAFFLKGLLLGLGLGGELQSSQPLIEPDQFIGKGSLKAYAIHLPRRWVATVGSGGTFLWSLTSGELIRQLTHQRDFLYEVTFTKDAQEIVAIGSDRTSIWETKTFQRKAILPGGRGNAVSWSSTAHELLLFDRGNAELWSTQSGERLATFPHPEIRAAVIYPSGTTVVTTGADQSVQVWDARSGRLKRRWPTPGAIFALDLSSDGSYLVGGGRQQVWIWEIESGRQLEHFPATRSGVLSEDNLRLLTKGADRNAHLWTLDPALLLFDFSANPTPLESVAFSPKDRWAIGAGRETTWFWNPVTGELEHEIPGHAPRFSSEGVVFLAQTTNGDFDLWESSPLGKIRSFDGHSSGDYYGGFSPGGDQIIIVDGSEVSFYDKAGNQTLRFHRHQDKITGIALSPEGTRFLSASRSGELFIWDRATGDLIHQTQWDASPVSVQWLSHPSRPLVFSEEGSASVWDEALTREINSFPEHMTLIRSSDQLPQHSLLATADESGHVIIRNIESLEIQTEIHVGVDVFSLALTPDGERIFIGARRGPSFLHEIETGKRLRTFNTDTAWSAEISPDGRTVLIAGATTWNLDSGQRERSLRFDDRIGAGVSGVRYSPDGRLIAGTGSHFESSVRVWDAKTGRVLATLDRHENHVTSLSFAPDSQQLMTTGADGRAMIWQLRIPPAVRFSREGTQFRIEWDAGTLESAPSPTGPWVPLGDDSPVLINMADREGFFRAALPEASTNQE